MHHSMAYGMRLLCIKDSSRPSYVCPGTARHHDRFGSLRTPLMLQQSHSLLRAQSRNKLSGQFSGNSRHGIGVASRHAVAASSSQMAVFPAGRKQVKVTLPAFIIIVSATEVLQRRDSIAEGIGAAISDGATGILLGDAQGLGGAELYEAAVLLKSVLRGRGILLIEDRTDIVGAAEADGVILSRQGLPTVVARRSLPASVNLVGRRVASGQEAQQAASDGASLLLVEGESRQSMAGTEAIRQAKSQQQGGTVPVIAVIPEQATISGKDAASLVESGADGVALHLDRMAQTAASFSGRTDREALNPVTDILDAMSRGQSSLPVAPASEKEQQLYGGETGGKSLRHLLDESKETLIEAERAFLSKGLALLQEVVPSMEEIILLREALKQLDQPFLVVIVGEFNSGKSTVINALLGTRFLAEGILPTTNEISVLKFRDEDKPREDERMEDGYTVKYLPAELLRDLNIVDTPGTNVILERQQRLTEEYVPRADMVLFTMSADRPFTDSEVRFLKYIRQWGKKVVFLVNKVDILSNSEEVDQVASFVANNARRVLGVDAARVLPVSARAALDAKLASTKDKRGFFGGNSLPVLNEQSLAGDQNWQRSRFGELEAFMVDFLVGGASAGESLRLKLQTPLFVSDALLEAARQQLEAELLAAKQDTAAVRSVQDQLAAFRKSMEADGAAQRSECRRLVSTAVRRAGWLVDEVLQLSNTEALSAYVFGSKSRLGSLPVARSFEGEVIGETSGRMQSIVSEHQEWLNSNCKRQLSSYRAFAEERAQALGTSLQELTGNTSNSGSGGFFETGEETRRRWREQRDKLDEEVPLAILNKGGESTAVDALLRFDAKAAALVLEEEVREAFFGSISTAIGAGVVGVVATWILPSTLEDILAIVLAGLAGYVALLNLPLRRADAKGKLEKVANNFIQEIESKLKTELDAGLENCVQETNKFMKPVEEATAAVVERVKEAERRRAELAEELEGLKQRAASVE